jgi:hypothetical protein
MICSISFSQNVLILPMTLEWSCILIILFSDIGGLLYFLCPEYLNRNHDFRISIYINTILFSGIHGLLWNFVHKVSRMSL